MQKNLYQKLIVFGLVAAFSVYIGIYLSPKTTPALSALPKITSSDAEQVARNYLKSIGENPENYFEYSYYRIDNTGSNFIINNLGLEKYREIMQNEELPLARWVIEYQLND